MDDYEFHTLFGEMLGNVATGVPDISKVTRMVNTANDTTDTIDKIEICPICQETFETIIDVLKADILETSCKHRFCKDCLTLWFESHNKCPVCMNVLSGN
jgi:E3 ubiquitin-protein ligase SHPRH